jgi:hypothetical protein
VVGWHGVDAVDRPALICIIRPPNVHTNLSSDDLYFSSLAQLKTYRIENKDLSFVQYAQN